MEITTRKIDSAELQALKDSLPSTKPQTVRDVLYTDLLIETVNAKGETVSSKTVEVHRKYVGAVVVQLDGSDLKEIKEDEIKKGISEVIEADTAKQVLFIKCDPALTIRVTDLSPYVPSELPPWVPRELPPSIVEAAIAADL